MMPYSLYFRFFLALFAACFFSVTHVASAQGVSERVTRSTAGDFIKTIPATILSVEGAARTMESISETGAPVEVETPSTFSNLVAGLHNQGITQVKVLAIEPRSRIITAETASGRRIQLEVAADALALVQVGDTLALAQSLP